MHVHACKYLSYAKENIANQKPRKELYILLYVRTTVILLYLLIDIFGIYKCGCKHSGKSLQNGNSGVQRIT